MDALQVGASVPSGFAGSDFYLTQIQAHFLFASNFLEEMINTSFYREYLDLNFDDKIFFHEPVNKFFDLLRVKRLILKAFVQIKNVQNPLRLSNSAQKATETEILEEIEVLYGKNETQLRLVSIKLEKLAEKVYKVALGNVGADFKKKVLEN